MVRGAQQPLLALTEESQRSPDDGDEPPPPSAANPVLCRQAQEAVTMAGAALDEARSLQEEAEAVARDLAWAEHAAQRTETQSQQPAAAAPADEGQGLQPRPGSAAPAQERLEPPEDSVSSWRPASPCPEPSWLYRRGGGVRGRGR